MARQDSLSSLFVQIKLISPILGDLQPILACVGCKLYAKRIIQAVAKFWLPNFGMVWFWVSRSRSDFTLRRNQTVGANLQPEGSGVRSSG
jgi:hypothetical protein